MVPTGCASAVAISACATAQYPFVPQVLPAYGLQDSRNEEQNHYPKSNPNTMCPPLTLGGNHGPGHFYLAKNRTFLLCVDTKWLRNAKKGDACCAQDNQARMMFQCGAR